jgi:hypothetical protein
MSSDAPVGWNAFRDKFVSTRGTNKAHAREGRKDYERQGAKREDGRSKRATGRDQQLNLKVTVEFKRDLAEIAKANKKPMNVMLEMMLAEWKARHAGRGLWG